MSRLALIRLSDHAVIAEVSPDNGFYLPEGGRVSPAYAGWTGGGELVDADVPIRVEHNGIAGFLAEETAPGEYQIRTEAGKTEGAARYGVVEIEAFQPPEGKVATGTATLEWSDEAGKVAETYEVIDAPAPPTAAEKLDALLAAYGLTRAEAAALLAGTA